MTLKTTKLRDAITFALAAGATTLAGTGIAFAQETEGQEATTLDRIEVTGSRIKRADVETSQPIFSLSREDIQAQGLTSIGDVIQNITANGSTLNTTFNNGGNGETRVSLRNLGSNRTLVLVNGRRWVGGTGLGGAVDLNTIPTAAVERIEVLKDGASTIYGSDAIAGVVNVILRQNYEGAEANAYVGAFDKGDGNRQAYDFLIGSGSDRFQAMVGFGYVKEEPVMAGDREISKEPVVNTGTAFGSTTTPNGRFGFGSAACQAQDNSGTPLYRDENGNVTTTPTDDPVMVQAGNQLPNSITPFCQSGTTTRDGMAGGDTAGAHRRFMIPDDVYNFAPENYLLTPQERRSMFAAGSVDITDDFRFKAAMTYNERKSEQLLAAMPVTLGNLVGSGLAAPIFISEDNLYNPFGEDVTRIQRRVVETGGRSFNQDVRTFAVSAGLEGTLTFGEKYFDWEAGYYRGENKSNDNTFGLFQISKLANALGPSMIDPATGSPICVNTAGDPDSVIEGCVPLNFLGGVGAITPEMLNYVTFTAHDETRYEQKTYYANISGDLFDLPGGPLAFSFGIEKRDESGYNQPDALINAGDTTGNVTTATAGSYDVKEAYLELAIPVLADLPFAELLDFSLATRHSDYSNFGTTLNSKFGFRWKPIEDLMVRGNWSEGFRAPSILELFLGQSDSFPNLSDPCNQANFDNLAPDAQARCIGQGVPNGGYEQTNTQIRITVGGNPDLQPETATSTTLGLVYSPSYVEGLDIALDWWKIKLEDAITTIAGSQVVSNCIRGNLSAFCDLYTRGPGGVITDLLSVNQNIGGQRVEGYDMTVNYRLPETAYGRFSFTWDTTYLAEEVYDLDGDGKFGEDLRNPIIGQPLPADEGGNNAGEFDGDNSWRIRSNLAARWEMGDWGATWNARFFSHQDESCQSFEDYGYGFLCTDTDRFVSVPQDLNNNGIWDGEAGGDGFAITQASEHHIGSTTYHDASVYWNSPWNARVTLGVNNLFDKDPPIALNTFANSFDPQYEVPGRFYYMKYSQKF